MSKTIPAPVCAIIASYIGDVKEAKQFRDQVKHEYDHDISVDHKTTEFGSTIVTTTNQSGVPHSNKGAPAVIRRCDENVNPFDQCPFCDNECFQRYLYSDDGDIDKDVLYSVSIETTDKSNVRHTLEWYSKGKLSRPLGPAKIDKFECGHMICYWYDVAGTLKIVSEKDIQAYMLSGLDGLVKESNPIRLNDIWASMDDDEKGYHCEDIEPL